MAISDDLRKRMVEAVVDDGLSRNAAAKLFKVCIASAVRWVRLGEARNRRYRIRNGDSRLDGPFLSCLVSA